MLPLAAPATAKVSLAMAPADLAAATAAAEAASGAAAMAGPICAVPASLPAHQLLPAHVTAGGEGARLLGRQTLPQHEHDFQAMLELR